MKYIEETNEIINELMEHQKAQVLNTIGVIHNDQTFAMRLKAMEIAPKIQLNMILSNLVSKIEEPLELDQFKMMLKSLIKIHETSKDIDDMIDDDTSDMTMVDLKDELEDKAIEEMLSDIENDIPVDDETGNAKPNFPTGGGLSD